jgi:hypothetical protein
LSVLANPSDLPRFDESRIWRELGEALQPLNKSGALLLERLTEPTENALRGSLAQGQWHVVHLVVHAWNRSAARYGTIALQSVDGRARNLSAAYLATLFTGSPSLRLVVLQACDDASCGFEMVSEALMGQDMAVAIAPPLSGNQQRVFASKIYAGLLAGLGASQISKELAAALGVDSTGSHSVRLLSHDPVKPIFSIGSNETAERAAATASASSQKACPAPQTVAKPCYWQEELQRKRISGHFDVFLCHNTADKPAVKRIAHQLQEAGILPWLDEWELRPGQPWQRLLEQQIGDIKAAAVFVGSAGLGPWQEQEMRGFLEEFARRNLPVIPVILPDAPSAPELPIFLRAMTWVDFRMDDLHPLQRLIWGITGKRPDDSLMTADSSPESGRVF